MTCAKKALSVLMLTTLLGLWGCTQGTPSATANARLRELEARSSRLEDDYKTAIAARDQARKKVTLLEEQRAQLVQQVELMQRIAKERDDLQTQVSARTAERDNLQASLAQFGHDLQNLATKVDQVARAGGSLPPVTAAPSAAPPVSTPTTPAAPPAQPAS
jgi:hypothetical protein